METYTDDQLLWFAYDLLWSLRDVHGVKQLEGNEAMALIAARVGEDVNSRLEDVTE